MKEVDNVKSQLKISLPIAFENLVNTLMTLVDTLVISLVGAKELAALGAMSVIINMMQMSISTINLSNNTLVANSLGENSKNKIQLIVGNSIILTIIVSIITIIFIYLIRSIFPPLFNVDAIAITYLTIRLVGFIQSSLVTVLSGYQRTIGNQKNILKLRIFAVILNLILDLLAVKLGYGIVGVAIVTVIIDTILLFYLWIYSIKNITIKFVKSYVVQILKLFKWNFFERIVSRIDDFLFNLIAAKMGYLEYAVHVILIQIYNVYETFVQGIGDGITISIGIANGKGEKNYIQRIKVIAKKLINYCSFILPIIALFISIIIMFIALREPTLKLIFLKVLPVFILYSYIIISATYYFSILRGMKKFKFLAQRNVISSIIKIISAYILSLTPLGIIGVWIGFLLYGIVQKYLSKKQYNKLPINLIKN